MTSRLQPWPVELMDHYYCLLDEMDKLRSLYVTCLDLGIIDRKYGIVSIFLPKIKSRLKTIKQLCRTIKQKYDLFGRPPKWYLIVEETFMTAQELSHEIRIIKDKINENRWIEIRAMMNKYIKECERVTRDLEGVTLSPDLQVYREQLKDLDLKP